MKRKSGSGVLSIDHSFKLHWNGEGKHRACLHGNTLTPLCEGVFYHFVLLMSLNNNITQGRSEMSLITSMLMTLCQSWCSEPVLGPRWRKLVHRVEARSYPQGPSQDAHRHMESTYQGIGFWRSGS